MLWDNIGNAKNFKKLTIEEQQLGLSERMNALQRQKASGSGSNPKILNKSGLFLKRCLI